MDYVFVSIIIGFGVLLVTVIIQVFKAGRWSKGIEDRLKEIKTRLDEIKEVRQLY